MAILERILDSKRRELPALRARRLPAAPATRPVNLRRNATGRLHLVAEVKRRSPSAGALSTALSVEARASKYEAAGAAMVSVLVDEPFFDGSYEDLVAARDACRLPILCKEFVIDEVQLDVARAFGADAVLLIARCLGESRLSQLVDASLERGLVPLVEVANAEQVRLALGTKAELVGINARDLDTLEVDVPRARQLLGELPGRVCALHLSGLSTAEHVEAIARSTRADAALVGEALMRCDDPTDLLREMVEAADG